MILRRYMIRQVATTTALVLGFLVVLLLGGRLIRYFGIAAEGRLDVGLLFSIIGFNLPYFLELLLPLSFFIGLMLIFGRLYVDHEMAVINGSGLSRGYLGRLMTPLILTLFVIEAGLSLYGKPWGVKQSDAIWQQQALSSAFDLIETQSFISSDDYHLYVGSMSEDKRELRDVVLIQTAPQDRSQNVVVNDNSSQDISAEQSGNSSEQNIDSSEQSETKDLQNPMLDQINSNEQPVSQEAPALPMTLQQATANSINGDTSTNHISEIASNNDTLILAKRAVQVDTTGDSPTTQLDLYQGRRYEMGADNLVYSQISFERYRISIDKPPTDVVTDDDIATQSLPVLWQVARNQPVDDTTTDDSLLPDIDADSSSLRNTPNAAQVLPAQAELGYRLTLPWLIILAPMLAIPLAQVRPRQGRWLRLLPAILIYVSAALVIISIKSSVAKGNSSVWSNVLVIIAFMLLALYLNWSSRIHHRVRLRFGNTASDPQDFGDKSDV